MASSIQEKYIISIKPKHYMFQPPSTKEEVEQQARTLQLTKEFMKHIACLVTLASTNIIQKMHYQDGNIFLEINRKLISEEDYTKLLDCLHAIFGYRVNIYDNST